MELRVTEQIERIVSRDQRLNLTIFKNEFQDYGRAFAFLRRHKGNPRQHKTAHYKLLVESTKTLVGKAN